MKKRDIVLVITGTTNSRNWNERIGKLDSKDYRVLINNAESLQEGIDWIEEIVVPVKFILLEHNLTKEGGEGLEIVKYLVEKKPVVYSDDTIIMSYSTGYTREALKGIYNGTVVKHFPRKNLKKIRKCMAGRCYCTY